MDHGARTEKEQGLEEGVGQEMKYRDRERPDTNCQEHEPQLRDRRIREYLLDVGLHDSDDRREDRGGRADDSYRLKRHG